MSRGYRALLVHFGLARFFMAIPTENERERGGRSRRRGVSALLREHIGFEVFSAGSPLGAARPQTCAKEPLALWTLFIWVVMWGRFTRRRGLRRSEDLTGLRSFCACHAFLSECLAFGSRLLFAACAPNRTACDMFRSCSAVGRDRHSCVLKRRAVIRLCWFTSRLRVFWRRSRRRTKGTRRTESAARRKRAFA